MSTINKIKIAIVIPAYNEEDTIYDVIRAFFNELPSGHIYVIDNNSSDKTNHVAHDTLAELNCNGRVFLENTQGKAYAIRKAFNEINADIYIIVDADMTYPADAVLSLIKPVLDGKADMVVGDRYKTGGYQRENKRRFHNFGNKFVRNLINLLFGSNLNDILSGYRVFNRKFVKNFPILSTGFAIETELTLHALDKRFKIIEVPIDYKDRPKGSYSKLNTVADGIKIIKLIFQIFKDYRPLTFFSIMALFFSLSGLGAGAPVLIEFAVTRFITHVPLAILASGLMILSLISFSIGVILDTVVRNHRFQYELSLLKYSEYGNLNAKSDKQKKQTKKHTYKMMNGQADWQSRRD